MKRLKGIINFLFKGSCIKESYCVPEMCLHCHHSSCEWHLFSVMGVNNYFSSTATMRLRNEKYNLGVGSCKYITRVKQKNEEVN